MKLKRILVVQTASIGDVILSTSLIEKLHHYYPNAQIDVLVRKGNEDLFVDHPFLNQILIWDKSNHKYRNLLDLINVVREYRYCLLINLHRHLSSGILTVYSKAKVTVGFNKNPLSLLFKNKVKHSFDLGEHEIERNQKLISNWTDDQAVNPRLYPSKMNFARMSEYKMNQYICIAPSSLYETKKFPKEKWIEFIRVLDPEFHVYFIGSKEDALLCENIIRKSAKKNCLNLSGKLSLLETAALMKDALMNYVNDSAPIHIASAMDAATTAVFCSTIPDFGFGPLAEENRIIEIKEVLKCRPCGLHGKHRCPKGHFKCGINIDVEQLLNE